MYSVQDAASLFKSQKRLLTGRKGGPAGATVGTTGPAARPGQPADRHLLRDGHDGAADLPGHRSASPRCSTASSTACSRAPRRWCASAAATSPTADGAEGGRHRGLRRLRHLQVVLVAVGGAFGAIGAVVVMDRIGKGIRTAPRDAMISLDVAQGGPRRRVRRAPRARHHRRDDRAAPGLRAAGGGAVGVRPAVLVSFCFAILGVGVLVLFVREPARKAAAPTPSPCAARGVRPAARARASARSSSPRPCSAWRPSATASSTCALQRDARLRHRVLPAALHRHRAGLHAARRARRAPRRPHRARHVFLGGYVLLLGVYARAARHRGGHAGSASCSSCSARTTRRRTAC